MNAKPTENTYNGYNLNQNGNIVMALNVFDDGETWAGTDVAHFITAEMTPGGECFDSFENGYRPHYGDGDLIDLETISVSIGFIRKVYGIAFGENAINRDFSEKDVLFALEENSIALAKAQMEV